MIEQLFYILTFSIILWTGLSIVCPILLIKDELPINVQATNTPFYIKIVRGLTNSTGVIAQELYEAKFKQSIINTLRLLFGSDSIERDMEILGHEITVQLYPEKEQHSKRIEHAKALCKYYDCFKGWDYQTVYECMRDETSYAMVWIEDNINEITKLEGKYYDKA